MTEQPHISLVGAGAVGSLLAASLLSNGVPFKWVVHNPRRREDLTHFIVQLEGQAEMVRVPADTMISATGNLPACDWTIIAVKAHQVANVLAALPAHAAGKVLIAANGLHSGAYHLGLLYGGAQLYRDTLHVTLDSKLLIGALPGATAAGPELVPLLTSPWLHCGANEVIVKRMWHKLCMNCVINPLSALLDRPNGELLSWADAPLMQGVLQEVARVAEGELGSLWSYSPGSLERALFQLLSATASNSSSMREDIRAGRETEVDRLNLAVADLGEARGIPCPLTRALGIMIEALTNRRRGDSVTGM